MILSSYDPVVWTITNPNNVTIHAIILSANSSADGSYVVNKPNDTPIFSSDQVTYNTNSDLGELLFDKATTYEENKHKTTVFTIPSN